jgi:hypothetical protein
MQFNGRNRFGPTPFKTATGRKVWLMNASTDPKGPLAGYDPMNFFCEMTGRRGLSHTRKIRERLAGLDSATLRRYSRDAERELFNLGITFTVYSDRDAIDRILPFDVIPRILSRKDWEIIESGVKQRVAALNLFLHDVYHDENILNDGVVPADLVKGNANYRPEMCGFDPPHGTYAHICGIDIVRDERGRFLVLEDNARTPSGVSYVIENRHLMMRTFPSPTGLRLPMSTTMAGSWPRRCPRSRHRACPIRPSPCCRRASTTQPISSMCFWRARWARRWSRAVT